MTAPSQRWGYIRIMSGTIIGGILGFYVMHRMEIRYKVQLNNLKPLCFFMLKILHFWCLKCGFVLCCRLQEKMNERLRKYEDELKRKMKREETLNEFEIEESSKF